MSTKGTPTEVLIGVDDLAAALNINRFTIYKWATNQVIPCIRAGRKVRFRLSDVTMALQSAAARPGVAHSFQPSEVLRREQRSGANRHSGGKVNSKRSLASLARGDDECDADRVRAIAAATRGLGD